MKKLYTAQFIWLFMGTVFAWFTVYSDFLRFYNLYGDITKIKDCAIPNPITTACFYGAFAFLTAFIWSVYIYKITNPKKTTNQNKLHLLLIGSTLFAFSSLFLEVYHFYFSKISSQVSCSGVPSTNIFVTPCFIGSVFFLGSLIISTIIKEVHKLNKI